MRSYDGGAAVGLRFLVRLPSPLLLCTFQIREFGGLPTCTANCRRLLPCVAAAAPALDSASQQRS